MQLNGKKIQNGLWQVTYIRACFNFLVARSFGIYSYHKVVITVPLERVHSTRLAAHSKWSIAACATVASDSDNGRYRSWERRSCCRRCWRSGSPRVEAVISNIGDRVSCWSPTLGTCRRWWLLTTSATHDDNKNCITLFHTVSITNMSYSLFWKRSSDEAVILQLDYSGVGTPFLEQF